MEAVRTRYEVLVGTVVSKAALATFRVPVRPTAVPRRMVYRFRVPADRDLSDVLHWLTERDVQVLQIRRCPEPPRRTRGTAPEGQEEPPHQRGDPAASAGGVVVPFPAGTGTARRRPGRRGGRSAR
jgi:hypothetical protein